MSTSQPVSSRELYLRLMGYVRPYWRVFGVVDPSPWRFCRGEPSAARAHETPSRRHPHRAQATPTPYIVPLAIVGIFFARGVLGSLSSYTLAWVSNKVVLDLRNALFARLLTLPTRYYDDNNSAGARLKVTHEVSGVTSAATGVLSRRRCATAWPSRGCSGGCCISTGGSRSSRVIIAPRRRARCEGVLEAHAPHEPAKACGRRPTFMHVAQETIDCHREVKIFGGQGYEARQFDRSNQKQRGFKHAADRWRASGDGADRADLHVHRGRGDHQHRAAAVRREGIERRRLRVVSQPHCSCCWRRSSIHRSERAAAAGLASAGERVRAARRASPRRTRARAVLPRASGQGRYESVSFAYPGADERPWTDVSVSIEPGETIALVGQSGGGEDHIRESAAAFRTT